MLEFFSFRTSYFKSKTLAQCVWNISWQVEQLTCFWSVSTGESHLLQLTGIVGACWGSGFIFALLSSVCGQPLVTCYEDGAVSMFQKINTSSIVSSSHNFLGCGKLQRSDTLVELVSCLRYVTALFVLFDVCCFAPVVLVAWNHNWCIFLVEIVTKSFLDSSPFRKLIFQWPLMV